MTLIDAIQAAAGGALGGAIVTTALWLYRRWRGDSTDVYVLIDGYTSNTEDMVVSVHARRQGADLAAITHAQRVGPLRYPGMSSNAVAADIVLKQLRVVNRDVHDQDDDA